MRAADSCSLFIGKAGDPLFLRDGEKLKTVKTIELIEKLELIAPNFGYEIVDIEIVGGKGPQTLRIYIDKLGDATSVEQESITFDDLVEAQCWIEPVVDEIDPIDCAYTLEVSSPGIDRPLRTIAHFERFLGEDVTLKTLPIDGRKNWSGRLSAAKNNQITIEIDNEKYEIELDKIEKARLKGKFEFTSKRGLGNGD